MPRPASLALAGALLAACAPAWAAPRHTIERYALLATEGLRARALTVTSGDVGVNLGRLVVTGGLTATGSQLVADSVKVVGAASCAAVYGDTVRGASASCPASGSDGGALFADPSDACGAPAALPACAAAAPKIVVDSGAARTLAPGTYGDVVVGGEVAVTLDLAGGRYVFCSLRAFRNAAIRVHGPTEIVVAGPLVLDRGSSLGAAPDTVLGASDLRVIASGKSVKVTRGSTVTARLCAGGARLTLREAALHGTAVARRARVTASTLAAPYAEDREPCAQRSRLRNAYFGDLHAHTTLSFDAYAFDVRTTPVQAYAFAQGAPVQLPPLDAFGVGTQTLQIDRPLDFAALTDHSEFLGEVQLCTTPGSITYDALECQHYRLGGNTGTTYFGIRTAQTPPERASDVCGPANQYCLETAATVWDHVQEAAADAYDRTAACRFTSLVGYEYTASASVSTLHRNVIFRNDHVPFPTTVFEAPTRQELWSELRATCADAGIGCDVLVIPHNANESNGKMFQVEYPGAVTTDDERVQARVRGSMEPLMEVYQHKGAGECLAGISGIVGATDEQCAFEQRYVEPAFTDCGDGTGALGTITLGCTSRRDYLRGALLEGMKEDARIGENPLRLGVIGSTDTHNGTPGAVAEETFIGNRGTDDASVADRLGEGQFYRGGWRFSAGGLTGVWAEENSRPAIFDALRRREVFGTSGPRITVRMFGGFGLASGLCTDPAMIEKAYAQGVPMGSVLGAATGAPSFLVSALQDPGTALRPGTPLQRVQIVKLWLDGTGTRHEQVYDVAGDAGNGATVDDATCAQSGPGAQSLCGVWTDPEFDPGEYAAYYVRVLENPSCRWSTYQCNALAPADRPPSCTDPAVPRTVQERAWTSPIWYEPAL